MSINEVKCTQQQVDENALVEWLELQQDKLSDGTLPDHQIEELQNIPGWRWIETCEDVWNRKLNELKEFVKINNRFPQRDVNNLIIKQNKKDVYILYKMIGDHHGYAVRLYQGVFETFEDAQAKAGLLLKDVRHSHSLRAVSEKMTEENNFCILGEPNNFIELNWGTCGGFVVQKDTINSKI